MARAPTPAEVLKMRGSYRKDRHGAVSRAPAKGPVCPRWLDDEARRIWRQTIPPLAEMGIVQALDQGICIAYCATISDLHHCEELVRREGRFITNPSGRLVRHPAAAAAQTLRKLAAQMASELGLTSLGRLRLRVDTTAPIDPQKARFFRVDGVMSRNRDEDGLQDLRDALS